MTLQIPNAHQARAGAQLLAGGLRWLRPTTSALPLFPVEILLRRDLDLRVKEVLAGFVLRMMVGCWCCIAGRRVACPDQDRSWAP